MYRFNTGQTEAVTNSLPRPISGEPMQPDALRLSHRADVEPKDLASVPRAETSTSGRFFFTTCTGEKEPAVLLEPVSPPPQKRPAPAAVDADQPCPKRPRVATAEQQPVSASDAVLAWIAAEEAKHSWALLRRYKERPKFRLDQLDGYQEFVSYTLNLDDCDAGIFDTKFFVDYRGLI